MCLSSVSIVNPTKRIYRNLLHPYILNVKCNHCAECDEERSNEWYLRSYYEAKRCFDAGGYVIADTLTYSEDYAPKLVDFLPIRFKDYDFSNLDFYCFNRRHLRLFLVLLRQRLVRAGYGNCFKYFFVTEYGQDPKFSQRMHIHCLFFVNGSILPADFSRFVSSCWLYGRTDGIDYRGALYFYNRSLITSIRNDGSFIKEVAYITKYVEKDLNFDNVSSTKLSVLEHFFNENSISLDDDEFPKLKRLIVPFHLQSQGFGLYALDCIKFDDIYSTGMMSVPSSDDVVLHIPLPVYYFRHLFSSLVVDKQFGNRVWILNDKGISYKRHRLNRSFYFTYNKYKNHYLTACSDFRCSVDTILQGRSLSDFVKYVVFYRGRVSDGELPHEPLSVIRKFISSPDDDVFLNFVTNKDKLQNIHRFVSDGYSNVSIDTFINSCVINDTYDPGWYNYDTLFQLFADSFDKINRDIIAVKRAKKLLKLNFKSVMYEK